MSKLKIYTVKRTVIEYYSIEAKNKVEAIDLSYTEGDPYEITVKSEYAYPSKAKELK